MENRHAYLAQEIRSEVDEMERGGQTASQKNQLTSDALHDTVTIMIASFRHRGLKRFFEEDDPRKLPPDMVDRFRAILARLHQAEVIEDMNVHSYRLHPLKGSRKGEWGVTVRANWRITFRFEDGYALDVNLEDYH